MSIDTGFDPTRPAPRDGEQDARPSSSLKEEPVPHLDESAEEGAPIEGPAHTQPVEGARDIDIDAALGKLSALDEKFRAAVEKHPMKALGIAAIAGFLIGRVASRI